HKLQQEGKLQIKAEGGAYIDEEGWLHTGDIGKLLNADGTTVTTPIADASHFLHITGRSRNIIVSRGGTNIYPKDIEEKLLKSKVIAKIKVVLKWDETSGEFPYAYILPDSQHLPKPWDTETNNTIDNELNNLSGSIAAYKIPRGFEITNEETLKNIEKHRLFMFEDF
ncbi:MAG: hypothetical protein GY757_55330, partial [bacterium]|nr:hypothetical protein [bacterium]